jgi:hypothetical protein
MNAVRGQRPGRDCGGVFHLESTHIRGAGDTAWTVQIFSKLLHRLLTFGREREREGVDLSALRLTALMIKDMGTRPAELPATATAYALLHSTITDLIALHKLDTLTVAQLSGTSLLMIEKHYGHLLREHAAKALASLTL